MKKSFKLLSICAISFAMLLAGCKKNKIETPESLPASPNEPTTDLLQVKSNEAAFVMADCNSEFCNMICNRFTNIQNSLDGDQTRMVIIDKSSVQSLSPEQWTELAKVFHNDGAIIYIQPTLQDLADFAMQVRDAVFELAYAPDEVWEHLECLDYYGQFSEANPDLSSYQYEIIAINKDNLYIMSNLNDYSEVMYTYELVDQETGETDSIAYEYGVSGDLTTYRMGLLADNLVYWTDNYSNDKQDSDFSKRIEVEVPVTFNPKDFTTLDWGSRTVTCNIEYTIWSAHDLGRQQDNYVIKRIIQFDGSHLNCGPAEPDMWWVDKNDKPDYYGPYLNNIQVQSFFNGPTPDLTNWGPQNQMTSTSYTSNISWNINSGLTISASPGLNIGGGVTINKSSTTNVPDLRMQVWHNTNIPKYEYAITTRPKGYFLSGNHDIVAGNLRQDISMEQYYTWIVKPSDGVSYSFDTDFAATVEFLHATKGFLQLKDKYETATIYHKGKTVALPAPPRAIQEWRMFCETSDQNLINFISKAYERYFYDRLFQVPAATQNDNDPIDNFIKNFEKRLNCDKDLWRARGFTGDFKFIWRKSTTTEVYHTTNFHVDP